MEFAVSDDMRLLCLRCFTRIDCQVMLLVAICFDDKVQLLQLLQFLCTCFPLAPFTAGVSKLYKLCFFIQVLVELTMPQRL